MNTTCTSHSCRCSCSLAAVLLSFSCCAIFPSSTSATPGTQVPRYPVQVPRYPGTQYRPALPHLSPPSQKPISACSCGEAIQLPGLSLTPSSLSSLLYPTLIAACHGCMDNRAILEQEVSCQLLTSFLRSQLSQTGQTG